jgi:RNA polymerase-binding transcription factor DksA
VRKSGWKWTKEQKAAKRKYAVGDTKIKAGRCYVMCEDRDWRLRYRLRIEEKLGRKLLSTEQVHHIDGDPLNDELDNLEVVSLSEHNHRHKPGVFVSEETRRKISEAGKGRRKVYKTKICLGCGNPIPNEVRRKHHNQKFCNRNCYGLYKSRN